MIITDNNHDTDNDNDDNNIVVEIHLIYLPLNILAATTQL